LTPSGDAADDGFVEVRVATADELPAVARTLARAFDDDPVTRHLIPPGTRRRHERVAAFMALGTKASIADGTVWTTPELRGAAVWRPPGRWRVPAREALRDTPAAVRALGRRLLVGLATLRTIESRHPTEPHWYLEILGTEPGEQGRGVGGALVAPVLDRCDEEGVPAYLESSKERNVPYYERFGFRVTGEIDLPRGGPRIWPMWRDPRP
jgi:GNAT superfamily N-acetyltransferase